MEFTDDEPNMSFYDPAVDQVCYPEESTERPAIPEYDGVTPAEGTTNRPWRYVDAPLQNAEGERDAALYNEVIDQFAVENNERYRQNQQGRNETYCNVFASDVTRAMGAEIPHRIDEEGNPVDTGGRELTANATVDWINEHGDEHGWRAVTAEEAQQMANEGRPTVALWQNDGGIGHEMVVRPEDAQNLAGRDAEGNIVDPLIAQAGRRNEDYTNVGDIISDRNMAQVEYWTHE